MKTYTDPNGIKTIICYGFITVIGKEKTTLTNPKGVTVNIPKK